MSADRIDHPGARDDYLEAVRHYREIDDVEGTNLSTSIIDRFEIAVAEVLADPTGWTRLEYWNEDPAVFKRSVGRFPLLGVVLPSSWRTGHRRLRIRGQGTGLLEAPGRRRSGLTQTFLFHGFGGGQRDDPHPRSIGKHREHLDRQLHIRTVRLWRR